MLWKIFGNVKTFLDKCRIDNITAFAAQSAFFIILSVIPFLVVFSSLLKYTPISQDMLTTAVGNYAKLYFAVSELDHCGGIQSVRRIDLDRGGGCNLVICEGLAVFRNRTEYGQ